MKVVPTPLLKKKRAAAAKHPIPIMNIKRETKVAADNSNRSKTRPSLQWE